MTNPHEPVKADVDAILEFVNDTAPVAEGTLAPDTSLFRANVLDSLNLVGLISFVEEKFGIRVHPMDVTVDNFDTANSIARFVERRRGSAARG